MENRWFAYLIPPFLITLVLVAGSQYVFIENSFYEDLGLGRTGNEFTLVNYFNFFTDPFYMQTFWVTTLLELGLIDRAYSIIGTQEGVVVGLMHFTIGFSVLLLYSVVITVPPSLEYAAQIHGASRWRVYQRVIIPLCVPGFVVGGLMIFNMCMGAFTSAALLGGGRVLTLPVLIQRTVMMEVRYSTAASIAFVLLISVILINLISLMAIRRFRSARLVIA